MTAPCACCGEPTEAVLPDVAALAAFLLLGVLCRGCYARQEIARGMEEV